MGAAVIAAAIRRREQQVIDDFRAAGATSPDRAQSYTAIGLGESLALRVVKIDPEQRRMGLSLKRVSSPEYMDADYERALPVYAAA